MSLKKSIGSTYFTATAVLLVASIFVMGFVQMYLVTEYFTNERRDNLSSVVDLVARQVPTAQQLVDADLRTDLGGQALLDEFRTECPERFDQMTLGITLIGKTSGTLIVFADETGRFSLCSEEATCEYCGRTVGAAALRKLQQNEDYFEIGTLGGAYDSRYYTAASPIYNEMGVVKGYIIASASAQGLAVFLQDMFSSFILSAGLMLLVSSILSAFMTMRLVEPLRRIAQAARKFGGGDFTVRVPVTGENELSQLGVTFNNMASNLEAIDSSRSSFMGNLAHELRTPMTSIKGFIDGMLDGTIPPSMQPHYLTLVSHEVGRLARLTQNMLDITKLEAGEYTVKASNYDVWETITGVVFASEKRVEEGKIELQGLAPTKTMVYADQDLVYQVLYNLLDNAFKFTPEGGSIRFSVQKQGEQVAISVRNTGDGIAADALPFVFERFYKADKSRGLNTRGSGLGLHICKVLVGLSGGEITVDSAEGEWCEFRFTLPCEPPRELGKRTPFFTPKDRP